VVECDRATVGIRNGPEGFAMKGDIVGVRRVQRKSIELVRDSDVRRDDQEGVDAVTCLREIFAEASFDTTKVSKVCYSMTVAEEAEKQAEVVVKRSTGAEHDEGVLGKLSPCDGWKGNLESGCLISDVRRRLYGEVIALCHRRIFEENLQNLWEGERDKMPTPKSLEAKLFDSNTIVLHATVAGKMAGGAILKEIRVNATSVSSGDAINSVKKGRTKVGYIDSAAAVPGSHAGSIIWEVITRMHFSLVACHPVLNQATVDFWQSRGMARYDSSIKRDCEQFKQNIWIATVGKVSITLPDLVEALPKSKLPLLVWCQDLSGMQGQNDPTDHLFQSDDDEEELSASEF